MTQSSGKGSASHGARRSGLPRAWSWLVEGFSAVGTVMIGVLMVIICADIVARNLMGSSLPLVSEAGALLLVVLVALQLAATVRAGRLARTELVIRPLTERFPRVGAVLAAFYDLAGAFVLGLIAWATIHILEKDFASAEFIGVTGIATIPTWPFRVLILLGFAVAALESVFRVVTALRRVGRPDR